MISDFRSDRRAERYNDINPGTKPNQPVFLSGLYRIAFMNMADDTAGDEPDDLFDYDLALLTLDPQNQLLIILGRFIFIGKPVATFYLIS